MDGGMYEDIVKLKLRLDNVEGKINMLTNLVTQHRRSREDIKRVMDGYFKKCEECRVSSCEECDIGLVIEALADESMLART